MLVHRPVANGGLWSDIYEKMFEKGLSLQFVEMNKDF